jgi:AcrR family transcriptional regulator
MSEPEQPAGGRAEATKARILDAAFAEFSRFGVAGARVDRIAKTAACNKNLIYIYFGSKEGLFEETIRQRMALIYEENPLTPGDLAAFAGQTFDFVMANPDVIRLLLWTRLDPDAAEPASRADKLSNKIAVLRQAQNEGEVTGAWDVEFILTLVMSLATAWVPAFPYGAPGIDHARVREQIVRAVRLIVEQ